MISLHTHEQYAPVQELPADAIVVDDTEGGRQFGQTVAQEAAEVAIGMRECEGGRAEEYGWTPPIV